METHIVRWLESLGPWFTRFTVDGYTTPGKQDMTGDSRVKQYHAYFPELDRVLELGSFEGGHTFQINAKEIVAVEGRAESIARAEAVRSLRNTNHITFHQRDLEVCDLKEFGKFDVIFCVGVLYHMMNPHVLLKNCADVSDNIFMWTHIATPEEVTTILPFVYKGEQHQLDGKLVEEHGLADVLSGLRPRSFWMTEDSLKRMLAHVGYQHIPLFDVHQHENGLAVTLVATKQKIFQNS